MDVTGLPSGTVYPALRKLERSGFVRSRWESERAARKQQRPARRYYEVTGAGVEVLSEVTKRFRLISKAPVPEASEL
jgi:PadR family transcriptional regulator, regulatory protein PadR